MANLNLCGQSYTVDHVVKGADYIRGYGADGSIIISIEGVTDFSCVDYDGVYMTPEECLQEDCNGVKYVAGKLVRSDGTEIPTKAVGVKSWNDLEDKPFGEEVTSFGDTLTWDGTPTDTVVSVDGISINHMSDSVPTAEELVGSTVVFSYNGEVLESEITEEAIGQLVENVWFVGDAVVVVYEDGISVDADGFSVVFPKKGVYFAKVTDGEDVMYNTGLTIPNYNFVKEAVHKIDPKFLPEGGVGYEEVIPLGNALTWDGTPSDTVISLDAGVAFEFHRVYEVTPPMEDLFGGFIEANLGASVTVELTTDNLMAFNEKVYGIVIEGTPVVAASLADDLSINVDGLNVYIPKKGVYFAKIDGVAIVQSLYKDGYSFMKTKVHKLNPKYLPDWNDWEGKPFGEDTYTGEIVLEYDGDSTGGLVVEQLGAVKVSDLIPTATELIGAVASVSGQEFTITEDLIVDLSSEGLHVIVVAEGMMYVFYEPYPVLGVSETGVYIPAEAPAMSLRYNGTGTKVKKLDPKYLEFSKEVILVDNTYDVSKIDGDGYSTAIAVLTFEAGKSYTVEIDGVRYSSVAIAESSLKIGFDNLPIKIYSWYEICYIWSSESREYHVKISTEKYIQIPKECIGDTLPKVTEEDEGKVLTVSGGKWGVGSALPAVSSSDNGKFLQVVDGAYALVALQDVSKEGM